MYSGISGLTAHSERMTVIGNNLANVNTIGFKGSRMQFEDLLSSNFTTVNGTGQVGRGVRVSTVFSDFGQGAFETSTEATDMAISGDGFFVVSPLDEDDSYYSRAGNFRFDNNGYLVDPHGYALQGWEMEATTDSDGTTYRTVGSPTDIRMENFQSDPNPTSYVNMVTNLDPGATDNSTNTTDPFFAMMGNWDGSADDPIASTQYAYSTTLKVYDDIGTAHNMTTYFDPVDLSNAGGDTAWEFMVTVEPSADKRILEGDDGSSQAIGQSLTSAAGLLMVGTITFTSGTISGVSAYTLQSNGNAHGGVKDLDNWKLADFSTSGWPTCTANFLGKSNASSSIASASNASNIQIDFGISNGDLTSNGGTYTEGWDVSTGAIPTNAGMVGNVGTTSTLANFLDPSVDALASQSFDTGGSSTLFESQDGYSAGVLQNLSVSREGVLSGHYSNGEVLELYAVTLATFTNEHGLWREGGNLFSETNDSGPALTGQAGSTGKGTVDGNALETSNVDMATEFVRMITTQRGFQANTKVITTADSMLGEVIAMKR